MESNTQSALQVGATVLWKSAKGYTPPNGELAVIDCLFPEGWARLTLDAPDAPPEFGGKCSMCCPVSELVAVQS